MSVKNSVQSIPLSTIDSATLTGTYQLLSAIAGIPQAVFYLKIINGSTVPATISYDGTNDHDIVRANSDGIINFQTNNQPSNQNALLPKFTKIFIKGTAGTGSIGLSGWFQPSGQMGV